MRRNVKRHVQSAQHRVSQLANTALLILSPILNFIDKSNKNHVQSCIVEKCQMLVMNNFN